MLPSVPRVAMIAVLAGCAGLASAAAFGVMRGDADVLRVDETTGSVAPHSALPLSDEQRARIFDSVMRPGGCAACQGAGARHCRTAAA